MALNTNLREFPGISHLSFQHPLDRQARAGLEQVPFLPDLMKKISGLWAERVMRLYHIGCNLQVNARQYPSLYKQYVRIAQILDMQKLPELFVETSPVINAISFGLENYSLTITSSLIDLMTEDELLAILGHELGHVKCDHMLYKSVGNLLNEFGASLLESYIPVAGPLARITIQLAILEWNRKAELSCDRAALLAVQDKDIICSVLAKLAGFSNNLNDGFSIEEARRQADTYEDIGANSFVEKMIKVTALLQETHPYPVVRINEISKWAETEEYEQIMRGEYKRLPPPRPKTQAAPLLETPVILICSNCKTAWPAGTFFCGKCATNMKTAQMVCRQCRSGVEAGWTVCLSCGSQLQAEN